MQHFYPFQTKEKEKKSEKETGDKEIIISDLQSLSAEGPDERVLHQILQYSSNLQVIRDSRNRLWNIMRS